MASEIVDLGSGYSYELFVWKPDRELNPQYDGIADLDPAGLPHGQGGIHFDCGEPYNTMFQHNVWQVKSTDLMPSIHRLECDCHGYITDGKWVAC